MAGREECSTFGHSRLSLCVTLDSHELGAENLIYDG